MRRPHVWILAQLFVYREVRHALLKEPLELADLEALLTYRPWDSRKRKRMYRLAINQGHIPALRQDFGQMLQAQGDMRLLARAAGRQVVIDSWAAILLTRRPELLPSLQSRSAREELRGIHEEEAQE